MKNKVSIGESQLFSDKTFDNRFIKDVESASSSILIESPFIRLARVVELLPVLTRPLSRGVRIVINTRPPEEHDLNYCSQAEQAVTLLQNSGVLVLYTVKHHRKLAIIDRIISWEGSLNILSYYDSCEIMRRTTSIEVAEALINFIDMNKYLTKDL